MYIYIYIYIYIFSFCSPAPSFSFAHEIITCLARPVAGQGAGAQFIGKRIRKPGMHPDLNHSDSVPGHLDTASTGG